MSLYLVTGGAGFIGSHIAYELLEKGEEVRIFDNVATGRPENLNLLLEAFGSGQLEIIEGDLRSYHSVHQAVQGVDYVIHQAALPSVPRSVGDPITSNDVNSGGTLNLLHAAHASSIKRLVYASSSSVYGNTEILPKTETMETMPLSPYAVSKLAAEQYCQVFTKVYGFETVCLRYFNVFGPRQDPHSPYAAVIPKFIEAVLNDQPVKIQGDGLQSRDFTYISNVVHANLLACHASAAAGEAINVSCGSRHTLLHVVGEVEKLIGHTVGRIHTESRRGDVKHSQADIEKAGRLLGYEPQIDFYEGLEKTYAWYSQQHAAVNAAPVNQ